MWHSGMEDKSKPEYFNYFSYQPQGAAFLMASIDKIVEVLRFASEPVKRVKLWTDNGLKSYSSTYCWSTIQDEFPDVEVAINHFAPHHGHGPADAIFGRGKLAIRRKHVGQGLVSAASAMACFQPSPNCHVAEISDYIDPFPFLYKPWKIGITNWFRYKVNKEKGAVNITAQVHRENVDETDVFVQAISKNHSLKRVILPSKPTPAESMETEQQDEDDGSEDFSFQKIHPGPKMTHLTQNLMMKNHLNETLLSHSRGMLRDP
jgi:hypothetical protein